MTTWRPRRSRSCYEKFPTGPYAERSAWSIGWRSYTSGNFAETVRVVRERGRHVSALRLPSAVPVLGRPRAREARAARRRAGAPAPGLHRLHELVLRPSRQPPPAGGDGRRPARRSARHLPIANGAPRPRGRPPPPTRDVSASSLAAGLYDTALNELHFAQKVVGHLAGDRSDDGVGLSREGGAARAPSRSMRRAYPQFLAESGEGLPAEILQIIFPLDLLGRDQEERRPLRARSLRRRRAGPAGVDVRRRRRTRAPMPGA